MERFDTNQNVKRMKEIPTELIVEVIAVNGDESIVKDEDSGEIYVLQEVNENDLEGIENTKVKENETKKLD